MGPLPFWLQTMVVVYLVLVEPFYGVHAYRQMKSKMATEPLARIRFYRQVLALEWGLAGLVALSLWIGQIPAGAVGIRPPIPDPLATAMTVGLLTGILAPLLVVRLSSKLRLRFQAQFAHVDALLPARPAEEAWFFAVAVTAGVCEELLFRGFLSAYVQGVVPGWPDMAVVAVSAAVFGLAHLYQGWKGVLGTGLLGAGLALLYLRTGSLLWPVLCHALLDLRLLALLRIMRADVARAG